MAISELLRLAQKFFFSHDNCSNSDIAIFVREVFKKIFFLALSEGSDFLLSHCQTFVDQYSLIYNIQTIASFFCDSAHPCFGVINFFMKVARFVREI